MVSVRLFIPEFCLETFKIEREKGMEMAIRLTIELTDDECKTLHGIVTSGEEKVRKVKRAQVIMAAASGMPDVQIQKTVQYSLPSIWRVKRRFLQGGLEKALNDDSRPGAKRKLSGKEEALLIATACTNAPTGRSKWTCELLAGELVKLTEHAELSRETVRRRLAENQLKPWQKKMWCIPKVDAEFAARMEDVLDLYAETPNPDFPVVCFDESPYQQIFETRIPIAAVPGKPHKHDYEYRRGGVANLFVFLDAHQPWRHVKATETKKGNDFAICMRELVDIHYPEAKKIRVVLDNFSTHSEASLYRAYDAEEARRILRKLEFHYTPKHASWLNMVEIEIGVLKSQCLDKRMGERSNLEQQIAAWQTERNKSGAKIKWMFTVDRARKKMGRLYPQPELIAKSQGGDPAGKAPKIDYGNGPTLSTWAKS